MKSKIFGVFLLVQVIGEIAFWTWEHLPSPIGGWLWGASLILLFPGNFLSAVIIEQLLWNRGLTPIQLVAIEVPVELLINAFIWLGLYKLYGFVRSRFETKRSG